MAGSSIGRKMIVAITGVILMIFVVGHLLGKLGVSDRTQAALAAARVLGPITD